MLHGIPQLFCFFSLPSLIEVFGFLFPEAEFGTFRISGQVIHSVVAISKTQLWGCGYVILIDWLFISGCWCHHRNRMTVIPVGGCTPSIPEVGCQPLGKTEMVAVGGADWQYNFFMRMTTGISEIWKLKRTSIGTNRFGHLGWWLSSFRSWGNLFDFKIYLNTLQNSSLWFRSRWDCWPLSALTRVRWALYVSDELTDSSCVSEPTQAKARKALMSHIVQDKTLTHHISNPRTKRMNK